MEAPFGRFSNLARLNSRTMDEIQAFMDITSASEEEATRILAVSPFSFSVGPS